MLTYDFKLGKSVRVHHGITFVLRRDVPGPCRHCKNGATIRNLKPLAILCGCTARFVSDLVINPEDIVSYDAARSTLTLIGQMLLLWKHCIEQETKMKELIRDYGC